METKFTEQQIRDIIRDELQDFFKHEKYVVSKPMQFLDGRNVQVGKTTGTTLGTETTQKLSVYGVTPVIQANAISAPSSAGPLYDQSVAQSAVSAINSIRTALKNFGITA